MGNSTARVNVLAGSHIPVLDVLINVTRFDKRNSVLELGSGFNSTPFLYWMCQSQKRHLESYENDREWIEKVGYPIFYTENFSIESPVPFWSIVFVDHRPARKRRSSALFFKDKARFVVLHDSELADNPAYKYRSIYKDFKYRFEYVMTKPYTIILSNFDDPSVYFPLT